LVVFLLLKNGFLTVLFLLLCSCAVSSVYIFWVVCCEGFFLVISNPFVVCCFACARSRYGCVCLCDFFGSFFWRKNLSGLKDAFRLPLWRCVCACVVSLLLSFEERRVIRLCCMFGIGARVCLRICRWFRCIGRGCSIRILDYPLFYPCGRVRVRFRFRFGGGILRGRSIAIRSSSSRELFYSPPALFHRLTS
jgi:hypothetical protein